MLVYVAVALAVALVLRRGDGPAVVAGVSTGIVLVVSYGLATRLFPDHFGSPDDPFNQYRLSRPLGYWNSFGLFAAMGVVLVVGVVAHSRRGRHAAVAAATAPVLVTALYFTFSRGSWIALGFAFAATIASGSAPRALRLVAGRNRSGIGHRRRRRITSGCAHDRGLARGCRDPRGTSAWPGCWSCSSSCRRRSAGWPTASRMPCPSAAEVAAWWMSPSRSVSWVSSRSGWPRQVAHAPRSSSSATVSRRSRRRGTGSERATLQRLRQRTGRDDRCRLGHGLRARRRRARARGPSSTCGTSADRLDWSSATRTPCTPSPSRRSASSGSCCSPVR